MARSSEVQLPPLRTLDDFVCSSARFSLPDLKDPLRWNNRVINNLLYYQTNYLATVAAILLLVGNYNPCFPAPPESEEQNREQDREHRVEEDTYGDPVGSSGTRARGWFLNARRRHCRQRIRKKAGCHCFALSDSLPIIQHLVHFPAPPHTRTLYLAVNLGPKERVLVNQPTSPSPVSVLVSLCPWLFSSSANLIPGILMHG
ncbi:PRA1 family protein 2 isoform X1 [Rhincodon typus]|uniref:PRA1 family protein 2 isoform X1 n=1 Tax=Rhincodon typus TaxID=259920 RepID=UPI00202F72DE|nr:PRA1 family protein 2 isoform X1 [Rhincodon typus]